MANIIIHNQGGTVNIYNVNDTKVADAKDKLLTKLFYARNTATLTLTGNKQDGYSAWTKLLEMYYDGDFKGMYDYIASCKGKCGDTRKKCLGYLKTIMKGE